jgi:hypothetical protein
MASILIIDDEVAIATAFAMFFRHDGAHVVTEAYTGGDGIAAYNRLRPDLVLLDVRLPDMTGFDVLAAIREHHPVVIMVTAFGDVPPRRGTGGSITCGRGCARRRRRRWRRPPRWRQDFWPVGSTGSMDTT